MNETLTPNVVRILLRARPQIVCLHGMPQSHQLYAAVVWRDLLAHAATLSVPWHPRLWIGVACDTPIAQAAMGHLNVAQAMEQLEVAADVAAQLNAELVLWNAEAACKINSARSGAVAQAIIAQTRARHSTLVQGHTAYGPPTVHPQTDEKGNPLIHGYPWWSWCGTEGVDVAFPQDYAAPDQPADGHRIVAPPGALRARMQRDLRSWEDAVSRQWIRADLLRYPYVQLHHVPFAQTATYATDPEKSTASHTESTLGHTWIGWTVEKDRCDADGELALCIAAELYRRGKSIAQVQTEANIHVDGIAGIETARALGVVDSKRDLSA